MAAQVNIKHLDEQESSDLALKTLFFGFRQAGLAIIDHMERYMRAKGWYRGLLTSEYRRRGREYDRQISQEERRDK